MIGHNVYSLRNQLKGQIVLPEDHAYNDVRKIWNALIDRHPALIVRCAQASDVVHSLAYAREFELHSSFGIRLFVNRTS